MILFGPALQNMPNLCWAKILRGLVLNLLGLAKSKIGTAYYRRYVSRIRSRSTCAFVLRLMMQLDANRTTNKPCRSNVDTDLYSENVYFYSRVQIDWK